MLLVLILLEKSQPIFRRSKTILLSTSSGAFAKIEFGKMCLQQPFKHPLTESYKVYNNCLGSLFRSNAIQLAGSYLSYMGRVRVAASEFRWGSICGDGWDTKDATVVCRQLGFQIGGVVARPKLEFGQRTGPVVMSQVRFMPVLIQRIEKYFSDLPMF